MKLIFGGLMGFISLLMLLACSPTESLVPSTEFTGSVGSERILNGSIVSDYDQYGFFVRISIQFEGESESQFLCGGTLLNERTVLTAAHCMQPDSQGREYMLFADIGPNGEGTFLETIKVRNWVFHDEYNSVLEERPPYQLILDILPPGVISEEQEEQLHDVFTNLGLFDSVTTEGRIQIPIQDHDVGLLFLERDSVVKQFVRLSELEANVNGGEKFTVMGTGNQAIKLLGVEGVTPLGTIMKQEVTSLANDDFLCSYVNPTEGLHEGFNDSICAVGPPITLDTTFLSELNVDIENESFNTLVNNFLGSFAGSVTVPSPAVFLGDSGGPLLREIRGVPHQQGWTSTGYFDLGLLFFVGSDGNPIGFTSAFGRISTYLPWIQENMELLHQDLVKIDFSLDSEGFKPPQSILVLHGTMSCETYDGSPCQFGQSPTNLLGFFDLGTMAYDTPFAISQNRRDFYISRNVKEISISLFNSPFEQHLLITVPADAWVLTQDHLRWIPKLTGIHNLTNAQLTAGEWSLT